MIERSHVSANLIFVTLGILVLFTVVNAVILRVSRSAALKRRVFVGYLAAFGLTFCVLVVFARGQPVAVVAGVLVALFYVVTQLLATRFCVACDRTVHSGQWFSRLVQCPTCGGSCEVAWRSHT